MYPNLSFVSPIHGTEGHLHNYLNFRLWRPIGPDKVEVWCWFMIDKAAPEEYKEAAYRGYLGSLVLPEHLKWMTQKTGRVLWKSAKG